MSTDETNGADIFPTIEEAIAHGRWRREMDALVAKVKRQLRHEQREREEREAAEERERQAALEGCMEWNRANGRQLTKPQRAEPTIEQPTEQQIEASVTEQCDDNVEHTIEKQIDEESSTAADDAVADQLREGAA